MISEELLDEIYEVLSDVNYELDMHEFLEDWSEMDKDTLDIHITTTIEDLYEIIESCKYAINTIEKVGRE